MHDSLVLCYEWIPKMDVNEINKTLWSMMDFEKRRPDDHLGHPITLTAHAQQQ